MSRLARAVLLFSILGFALPAAAGGGKGGKPAPAAPAPAADCKIDKDCVLAPDDCCGCLQGGKQKAIPSRDQKKDESERAVRCKDQMCAQVVSSDPSCGARAVCRTGTCALSSTPAGK